MASRATQIPADREQIQEAMIGAPSVTPSKRGDRAKTNACDALNLAKPLRTGELTVVWGADDRREAM